MNDPELAPDLLPFAPGYRACGLLLHVTSLPSPYGIGDVGPAAFAWVDRLYEAGQRWWQALPLGPTGYGDSPYQCLSSFAGNGLLISPDSLTQDGLLRADDCKGEFSSTAVDYDVVIPFKHRLLGIVWANFRAGTRKDLTPAYEAFCQRHATWLDDYALFRALRARYNNAFYLEWPQELVERVPSAIARAREELAETFDQVRFAQFLLFRQGKLLKDYALARGVGLIGDLPFFVSPDSSDVWANPDLFVLDKERRPLFVGGVPPDDFSATGQLWGNPVYDWEAHRRTGYVWWIERIRALLAHVEVIRLDHFRGFAGAWYVPAGAPTAESGEWVAGPGADFFNTVKRELGTLPFIAEDLGLITPDVTALRDEFQIPGTRVLQFGFDDGSTNIHLPHNYPANAVVYTGTHDNFTTREWFEKSGDEEQQRVWTYVRRTKGIVGDAAPELMRLAWSSPAALAIAPLQDLLNLGGEARMNTPGQPKGNWRWRATEGMLSAGTFEWLKELTESCSRSAVPFPAKEIACGGGATQQSKSPAGMKLAHYRGQSYPLGATIFPGGVNFSVFSRNATGMDLLFFDHEDDACPARVIQIDPADGRTYHYWHAFVPGAEAGQIYGFRAYGPNDPANGLRFDPAKLLLDPYGRAVVVPKSYGRIAAEAEGENTATAMKNVVVDPDAYDWEGDAPLKLPSSRTIVYEMHVRGFSVHPNSGVSEKKRGTYAGLIEKIPYLQELGITAVELLPVFHFDAQDCPPGRTNYWGYAPISFFAPHPAYSSRQDATGAVDEFRDMVKALHRAGIEVILDVVFNHTAEGNHNGPTLCFRGLDNPTYYILEPDRSLYANFSGTGNTLNANNPIVRRMIVDSIRYWVEEMHVDGFRFDLASILARDSQGHVMSSPPVLWDIESDPALAGTKMIAEAWDAAGLYQVGSFIGDSWKEWNGRFRDDIRDFVRGASHSTGRMADRLLGSPEIYGHKKREAEQSVNFVTCHDGFTLNDLVSYNHKHNEDNGELNRDGADDNRSWNCGVEGPSDDPTVEGLRSRQVKNFLTLTMLSLGMPMIVMGDEVRRSQGGNNNGYCQDNEISWFDWSLLRRHADVHRFLRLLIARRLRRDLSAGRRRLSLNEFLRESTHAWHGTRLNQPDWSANSHSLAIGANLTEEGLRFHMILNAFWEPLDFELPPLTDGGQAWRRWIDTALAPPADIVDWASALSSPGLTYHAEARSVVVLIAGLGLAGEQGA